MCRKPVGLGAKRTRTFMPLIELSLKSDGEYRWPSVVGKAADEPEENRSISPPLIRPSPHSSHSMRAEGRVRELLHRGSCVIAPHINASWYDSGSLDGTVGANNEIDRE